VDIVRNDEIGKLAETFNKMSEEIYKTDLNRRRFIGDVSHELKTPLTSIKALIESLIEGNNEISTYKEYLIDVNGEIDRLSLMVSSLLIVTRLEEIELNMRPVDLYEEVDSIIKLFLPLADQYDIKLINKCQKNVAVLMDEARFKEILINLVDNSIKYSREGGFVEISCIKREEIVELIVRDNGCGISEGDLHCVFDIFYRVDESRTRKTGGSGIGLYLVKKIVELHGWSIKVKSRLNEGTEFIINIKSGL
jgi:signal transduction histidine kinase